MEKMTEKYIAKALEGYEANHGAISEAITGMESQLQGYKDQRAEMEEGISDMKKLLGLDSEGTFEEESSPTKMTFVNDGVAVE